MGSTTVSTDGRFSAAWPDPAISGERRRRGRSAFQNPALIALLRQPSSVPIEDEHCLESRPAQPIRRLGTYLIALVLAAILPLAAYSVGVALWASQLEQGRQRAEFHRLAAATAATVATDIAQATLLTEALARSPALAAGDLAAFERHLRTVTNATGIALILGNRAGEYVINTARPPGASLRDLLPRPNLVRQVLTTGRPLLTDTLVGPHIVRPMAGLIVPVPDGGPQAAVVAARIDSSRLLSVLPRPSPWPGAFVVVYDGAGQPFATTAPAGASVPSLPPDVTRSGGRLEWVAASDLRLTAAVEPIAGTSWHVAMLAPQEAFVGPWWTVILRLAGAGLVVAVAAALLALLLGRFLVREAGKLVSEATALADEQPLAGKRSYVYEMDVLRRVLRTAASAARERVFERAKFTNLAETAAQLEARVLARTRDLEETTGRLLNAQDEERRRIARELHDSTVQELVAASLNLTAARAVTEGRGAHELAEAQAALDRAKEDLRTVSFLMQPPLLDECGLATALRVYAEGFGHRSGLAVTVEAPEIDPVLPRAVETALFRVVQEALTNVHRHANSPVARVRLQVSPTEAMLEVEDEGVGMAAGSPATPGVGIAGMRVRVRQFGGNLSIATGAGLTRVRVTVPLTAKPQSAVAA